MSDQPYTIQLPDGRRFNTRDNHIQLDTNSVFVRGQVLQDNHHITVLVDGRVESMMSTWRESRLPTGEPIVIFKNCEMPACHCIPFTPVLLKLLEHLGTPVDPSVIEQANRRNHSIISAVNN